MMSFCKKSVHSFLGYNKSMDTATANSFDDDNPPCKHGLGLITATGGDDSYKYRNPNVIWSSLLKLLPPPSSPLTPPLVSLPSVFAKKDPGGIGFIDDMGGGVDGLMSCTESLGFESSDERTVDDRQMDESDVKVDQSSSTRAKWRTRDYEVRRETKKFPPPLSCFNRNGQLSFFLRSVRTDGRLELTEVRIDRPEILRASREDGRLRLHLIGDEDEDEDDLDIECENVEQDHQQEEEEEEQAQQEEEEEQAQEEEEEEEERVGEWKFQVSGSERFRRCNEMADHHHDYRHHNQSIGHHHHNHHHNLHVWSQQCVPTR